MLTNRIVSIFLSSFLILALTGCAEIQFGAHLAKQIGKDDRSAGNYKVGKPYLVSGQEYYPRESFNYSETGIASWYGPGFHGKKTANGEKFDSNELTAAHRTLQMPSLVRVTNLENGRSLIVRVNDRGPYSKGRLIDVSSKAADLLGFKGRGTAKVRVDVLGEESRRIAMDARAGRDTRGYEVALNEGGAIPSSKPVLLTTAAARPMDIAPQVPLPDGSPAVPQPVQVVPVEAQQLPPISGHISADGRFLPDPVVSHEAVHPTQIYVQAGAFGDPSNAYRLSERLSPSFGGKTNVYPANIAGKSIYRVRLGPFANVDEADRALTQIIRSGSPKAIIVVD